MKDPGVAPDAHAARPRSWRRKAVAAAAVVALGFVSSLVLAEWLASGTGEGFARASVVQSLTTESAEAAASLYPGGSGDLVLRVHNPNPFVITLTTVSSNGPITSDDPLCDAGGHGVSFAGYSGAHPLSAESTTELVLEDVLTMASTSANECQGATFVVPVSLNGGSGGGDPQPPDGTACDDGDPDTQNDVIIGGVCVGDPLPPDGTACDDGDPDTQNDVIVGGVCVGDPLPTWYADADGDGYGDPAVTTVAAAAPGGYVAEGGDCDDSNAAVNPAAAEELDGVDNDCDGAVDE